MSRTVTPALKAAYLASQSNEVVLTFLTVTHTSSLATSPVYLVNNNVAVIRNGITYSPFAFSIDLPSDSGDASITIDAVDQTIITVIRSITERLSIAVSLSLVSDPDTIAVDLGTYDLIDVAYNSTTISGTLTYEERLDYQYPEWTMTPSLVPGSF